MQAQEPTYCLFWIQTDGNNESPCAQKAHGLTEALKFHEQLVRDGHNFIAMAVENPNMVGKKGVDVTGPDYDWKKRRK